MDQKVVKSGSHSHESINGPKYFQKSGTKYKCKPKPEPEGEEKGYCFATVRVLQLRRAS